MPVAFQVVGAGDGITVRIGTWSARAADAEAQDRRRDVVASLLHGLYPSVTLAEVVDRPRNWPASGLALGMPAPAGIDETDGAAPIDRIVRALAGTDWAALILAYPVAEKALGEMRQQVLNEVRMVQTVVKAEGGPSPLAEQYVDLLRLSLTSIGQALATGGWRTACYLLGDADSYPRLATGWRSAFSGKESLPEPVRVFDRAEVNSLVRGWAMPDRIGDSGPGHYRRPFEFQTFLTTPQLAAYFHLPELETPGFAVDLVPRFDTVAPAMTEEPGIVVGRIMNHRRDTGTDYTVSLPSLTRHVFVAGTTGSGKTNTIFSLLAEADAAGKPFLVIEPAKAEYRALVEHPVLGPRIRVFTAGSAVSPLLLNPFEVPPGTAVSQHLDLVRAAFTAAFGMWTPLPQILERCLHDVYIDRGWNLLSNTNSRLTADDDHSDAFPTLSDLITKVDEVITTLGYSEKVTDDMRAALTTRLESLRNGGKGAMLDVARSLPVADLLAHPTVVELESLGDEGDKAFVTGLLLIRLAEHRRSQGQTDGLVHLLVIEEAHRLLANVSASAGEEAANPRGHAVETFANLLSEVRAYGQGVVIADQVPVRLAPDVIKNTTLKIAHRTVSADDRAALGGAMAMTDAQTKALTTLGVGDAVVFGNGDDSPLIIRVPVAKNPMAPRPPGDDQVARHMDHWRAGSSSASMFLARPFCGQTCAGAPDACVTARTLAGDEFVQRALARTVLSAIDTPGALDRLWADLAAVLKARKPSAVPETELLRSFAGHGSDWFANRRGAQQNWSFRDTAQFRGQLRAALLAEVAGDIGDAEDLVAVLRATTMELHARAFDPYPACHVVCTTDPPVCLYRSAVADLISSGRYQPSWNEADANDVHSEDKRRRQTWEVCQDAAYELVEFPDSEASDSVRQEIEVAARRVCMCFAQQMLADDHRKLPRTSRRILARVLTEAGL